MLDLLDQTWKSPLTSLLVLRQTYPSPSDWLPLLSLKKNSSWEDPEGPVRTVCQSTIDVAVDAPPSFCCHILMLMFQLSVDVDVASVDVDVPASCC
jgi:hypothetical protein